MGTNLVRSSFTTGVPLCVNNIMPGDKGKVLGGTFNIVANIIMEPIQLNVMYKKLSSSSSNYVSKGLLSRTCRAVPFFALRDGLYSVALLSSPSNRYIEFMMPFVVGLLTATPDQVIKQVIYSKDICIKDCLRANLTVKSFGMPGPIMRAVVVGYQ